MDKWLSNAQFPDGARPSSAVILLLTALSLAVGLPAARAAWDFESLTHDPALPGQPLQIVVRLSGSGGDQVHVSAAVDQDPSYQQVAEAYLIEPNVREAQFLVPIATDAQGFWHFIFQVVENGAGTEVAERRLYAAGIRHDF